MTAKVESHVAARLRRKKLRRSRLKRRLRRHVSKRKNSIRAWILRWLRLMSRLTINSHPFVRSSDHIIVFVHILCSQDTICSRYSLPTLTFIYGISSRLYISAQILSHLPTTSHYYHLPTSTTSYLVLLNYLGKYLLKGTPICNIIANIGYPCVHMEYIAK